MVIVKFMSNRLRSSVAANVAFLSSALIVGGATFALAQQQAPAAKAPDTAGQIEKPEFGLWLDHSGDGAIEISPCGDKLCGAIVWLKQPLTGKGQVVVDANNPDKAKRARPVCGLQVIGNVTRQKDGSWDNGWIYDPNTGDQYDVAIRARTAEQLSVTGYLGIKLMGETFTWTRVPASTPLERCAGSLPKR